MKKIQGELDLYITNNRLNQASFQRRLDPISRNIIRNKNPIELLKDVKHFDAQNPIIGYLIKELVIGKKKDLSKCLDKARDIRDLKIRSRLNKLREKNQSSKGGDSGSSNLYHPTNLFPPLPPPLLLPPNFLNPRLPPPPSDFLIIANVLRLDEFLNNNNLNSDFSSCYVPSAPDPTPLRGFARNFFSNRTIDS